MTDNTQQIINWTIPLHNAKPGEEFITRSNGVAVYRRPSNVGTHRLYSVNDGFEYDYEPNGEWYAGGGHCEDDLVLRKGLLIGAVAGDRFITRSGEVVEFVEYLQLPDNTTHARCGSWICTKLYTLDGAHIDGVSTDGDLIFKVSKLEPKRINVQDVPVGSEVKCRNGELLTVINNDGTDQPIRAENPDRVHDDGGKTNWWYYADGRRNLDQRLADNPWDIVEITRRGPEPEPEPELEPPVSLEGVEVGDKLRIRSGGTKEVNRIADELGGGCIRAGAGLWYFKSGKLNLSNKGDYSEYDVIEVIKAPKPEPKKFNFNDDGGFVPGTLYETRGGDVFIYGKEGPSYLCYPFHLSRIKPNGEICPDYLTFREDGSYLEDTHDVDIVRRIGPAKVALPV